MKNSIGNFIGQDDDFPNDIFYKKRADLQSWKDSLFYGGFYKFISRSFWIYFEQIAERKEGAVRALWPTDKQQIPIEKRLSVEIGLPFLKTKSCLTFSSL